MPGGKGCASASQGAWTETNSYHTLRSGLPWSPHLQFLHFPIPWNLSTLTSLTPAFIILYRTIYFWIWHINSRFIFFIVSLYSLPPSSHSTINSVKAPIFVCFASYYIPRPIYADRWWALKYLNNWMLRDKIWKEAANSFPDITTLGHVSLLVLWWM